MDFLIADTFTDSLTRLTAEEQKSVKTSAFDLQLNPAHPGLSFHKLDKAKDKNFWSIRVGSDIRLIVHKTDASLLLCYVDHHDKAYAWAERRKLQTHPKTGAAQIVEVRETVQEVFVPKYVEVESTAPKSKSAKKPLFAQLTDEELLQYGVPTEWIADVRLATEETLLEIADHLPAEASEALLELATGGKPRVAAPGSAKANPFEHPDAQRRFRVVANVEELQRALDFPWDKWTVFLHPEQRQWIDKDYAGPARVSGSAGTGKTIVALHRAAHLARANPDARVLLTTFSDPLSRALQVRLNRLLVGEPKLSERIDVHSMAAIGQRLYLLHVGPVKLVSRGLVVELLQSSAKSIPGHKFAMPFLRTEWEQIVDAWQLDSWEAYRDVARLGRKTRLSEAQRRTLWSIFELVLAGLKERSLITESALFTKLASVFEKAEGPFKFAVVDEAQDISIAQLRFLAALAGKYPNGLFFAGDQGQRIFQQPFSWKSLGVEVRGRSRTLRVNYRTSHQIRMQADRLLGTTVTDVDGNTEDRSDTVSVFNGPPPEIQAFATEAKESAAVGAWIKSHINAGMQPHEIGLFVRSDAQLKRAQAAAKAAGVPSHVLDEKVEIASGQMSIATMHLAKGMEFRAVAVMACDDEVLPLQERIETVGDDADLQEVYDTERHLLYVACTRARDHLLVTCIDPGSEFLGDLEM